MQSDLKILNRSWIYSWLIFITTFIIVHFIIWNEFILFKFTGFVFFVGTFLTLFLLLVAKKKSGRWVWKSILISVVIQVLIFFNSKIIASEITSYNVVKIESLSDKSGQENVLVFYGLIPILKKAEGSVIRLSKLGGSVYIYDIKSRHWTIDG